MSGEKNLAVLLNNLSPSIGKEDWVFVTMPGQYGDFKHLNPLCVFSEKEGLSLIITKLMAMKNQIEYQGVYKAVTLEVHSSLESVGMTAAVTGRLAEKGISANVVAAFYHDHIFIPADKAEEAVEALEGLGA